MTSFQSLEFQQLVVGVDRVGAGIAVDIALRAVDGRDRDLGAHVFQRQAFGHELGRVDLDAYRRFLLAADGDLGDAGDLADLLRELGVDGVADGGQRQRVRCGRQQQDRRVRRVDLAIGRRRGKVFRQLAAGGIDRGLHVVGRTVDRAIEVELDRDRRRSEIARRGHLRDAGNLRQLTLQRLRHRRGHGFRTAAGQGRCDLNGREVDLRQWRDRQQRIGDEADEKNAGHHQRSADGVANERRGNTVAHSCLTLAWAGSELATAVLTSVPGETLY